MTPAFTPAAFSDAIEALRARRKPSIGDLTIWEVAVERERFAEALYREASRRRYCFEPARTALVHFDGRAREVFRSTVLDSIMERVVGRWLQGAIEPSLSDALWSYRTGRSSIGALGAFGDFVREHVRGNADPKQRGLFVLRRDVASYGKSIPNGDESRLWSLLEEHVGGAEREVGMHLLRQLVRRRYMDEDEREVTLEAGSPTGSPVQPPINNLYLTPLDRALGALPGHYARFGDDILFATDKRDVAQEAAAMADTTIADLGLTWSEKKTRNLYFNGAGRPELGGSGGAMSPFVGAATTELLGYEVTFAGTIRLPRRKLRSLLETLRARLRRAARMNMGSSPERLARELVSVVRAALDRRHSLRAAQMEALFHVDDREQLDQVDHLVRLAVAQLASGRKGPRAFRVFTPRRLRDLGLPSLVRERNQGTA
ncbi:MAG: reverse transcriptase domain-containing protein [Polyangiales bacterium]